MERVCERVIVIHEGRVLLDQPIAELRRTYLTRRVVTLLTAESQAAVDLPGVTVRSAEPHHLVLEVDVAITPVPQVVAHALANARIRDLTIEDPPMEEVVKAIYAEASQ